MGKRHDTAPGARRIRQLLVDLSIMAVIGAVLALIGPFGTFAMSLPLRLASWIGFCLAGYAIYRPLAPLVEWGHRTLELPRGGLWVGACIVATVPMAVLVWIAGFLPGDIPVPTLEQALVHYAYVLVIGGAVTALFRLLEGKAVPDPATAPATDPPATQTEAPVAAITATARPRLLDRLSPLLGSDLLALEMEDHYVRVHTALGSELILLRLRDAVAELDGIDGLQVHRSWWVARDAVEQVRRKGRSVTLVLANGIEAPVSRATVANLKAAGWL